MTFRYLDFVLPNNQILVLSNESDYISRQIDWVVEAAYKTKNIKRYRKLNGMWAPDPKYAIDDQILPCVCFYCEFEEHKFHYEKYFKLLLDKLLCRDWYQELYIVYFPRHTLRYFLCWLFTYISKIFSKIAALEIFQI